MKSEKHPRTSCFGRRRRLWFIYALRGSVLAVVVLAVIIGILGCDPKTKYKVLTFFFDGVPPLPGMPGYGMEPIIGPDGLVIDFDDPRAQAFLARDRARQAKAEDNAGEVISFSHPPYTTRKCMACHDKNKSFSAVTTETCQSCHKAYYDTQWNDWVHGPVALGKCSMCHLPHTSKYRGLLNKSARDLCFSCHNEARTLARPHHVEAAFKPCSTCHDPHFTGNRHLLVDAFSYQRRKRAHKIAAKGHAEWKKKVCSKCHDVNRSNAVLPSAEKTCVTCHDKVLHPIAGGKVHEPVLKGRCLSCHTAHASTLPHLVRPKAEGNCIECHKTEKLSKLKHSRFYRVECLLCHTGHSSPKRPLLRIPAPPPRPTTLPATMPATRPAASTENRP